MFKIKKENIEIDPQLRIPSVFIEVKLADPNGMILKAKAQFVADTIDRLLEVIDGKEAEFGELYGEEALQHVHFENIYDKTPDIVFSARKTVYSREVQQNLLNKAFETEESTNAD